MTVGNISIAPSSPAVQNPATASATPKKVMDQDDFLKLLVAQFTTQDPLNPQADMNSISQMATFTSLEQTKIMQADIARLQSNQELVTANSLIGREVALEDLESGTPVNGVVTGSMIVGGSPHIIVDNTAYPLSDVLSVVPVNLN